MPGWWLDEQAHAGSEHLDAEYVRGYERKAGFDPAEDVEVLLRHGLGPDSVVVDLGAGPGVFTATVAPLCRRVIAVDVSPAMTAVLRARVEELGLGNVEVVQAGFVSYEHRGDPADFVFSRNALHQIPDFWKGVALARVAAVLKPGGILRLRDLVYDFEPGEQDDVFDTWCAGAVTDPATGWTAGELAEHIRGRVQHLQLAAGADVRTGRLRRAGARVPQAGVRRVHLPAGTAAARQPRSCARPRSTSSTWCSESCNACSSMRRTSLRAIADRQAARPARHAARRPRAARGGSRGRRARVATSSGSRSPYVAAAASIRSSPSMCGHDRFVERQRLFDAERVQRGDVAAVRGVLERRPDLGRRPHAQLGARGQRATPSSAARALVSRRATHRRRSGCRRSRRHRTARAPSLDRYFVVAMPPSTGMTAPVTYAPARLARIDRDAGHVVGTADPAER